jgi:hypothetical protein
MPHRPFAILAFLGISLGTPALAADAVWTAASGQLPEDACPPWILAGNVGAHPLTAGGLALSTAACGDNVLFLQSGEAIAIPDSLVVEGRLVLDAGSECVGVCGHQRQAAAICVTTAPETGVLSYVGPGEVVLTTANCGGALVAPVANGGAHTYKLVIRHGSAVTLYFDGSPVLSGSTYVSPPDHGAAPRVLWGEGSSFAFGTSHWQYLKHNAHATGCTTSGVGDDAPLAAANPVAVPNPFRGATSVRFAAARAGHCRLEIFDLAGRLVRRLECEAAGAGLRTVAWDGADARGRPVSSGAYICRVTDGAQVRTGTLVKLR